MPSHDDSKRACARCGYVYDRSQFEGDACVICGYRECNSERGLIRGVEVGKLAAWQGRLIWSFACGFSITAFVAMTWIGAPAWWYGRWLVFNLGLLPISALTNAMISRHARLGAVLTTLIVFGSIIPAISMLIPFALQLRCLRLYRALGINVGFGYQPDARAIEAAGAGYCRHCGYDLRGIASERCPECGVMFAAR